MTAPLWAIAPFGPVEDPCEFRLGRPQPIPELMAQIDPAINKVLEAAWNTGCQKQSPLAAAYEKFKVVREVLLEKHKKITHPPPENMTKEIEKLSQQASDLLIKVAADFYILVSEGTTCEGKAIREYPGVEDLFVQVLRAFYASHNGVRQTAYAAEGALQLSKDIPEFLGHFRDTWQEELAVRKERGLGARCKRLEEARTQICPRTEGAPPISEHSGLFRPSITSAQWALPSVVQQRKGLGDLVVEKLPLIFPRRAEIASRLNDPNEFDPEGVFYDEVAPLLKHCAMEYLYTREKLLAGAKKMDPFFVSKCAPFVCPSSSDAVGLLHDPSAFSWAKDPFCQFSDNYRNFEARYLRGFKDYHSHRRSNPAVAALTTGQFCPQEAQSQGLGGGAVDH